MWGVGARGGGRGVVCREEAGIAQNFSALWADDFFGQASAYAQDTCEGSLRQARDWRRGLCGVVSEVRRSLSSSG